MKKFIPIILLVVLSLPIIKPLFAKGYFSMHDDTQIARVVVMGKAIRNGQFPVRWVSDLGYGYGYPLYNFYGPFPYYIGGFLYAAGLDGLVSTKIVMVLGMILSGVTMYALVTVLFGSSSGILAGLLYGFAPYHAVELYVRGAVGELWAYAFLPLLFLGLFLGVDVSRRKDGAWIGGLGLAGIILSHTISGYVTVVFYLIGLLLCSFILLFRSRFHLSFIPSASLRAGIHHSSLLLIGLGLSAFFWLPAIVEMGYTNVAGQIGATSNFRDHFVCLPQLWNSLWGYGGSVFGCLDGLSFKIGKLHVILAALGIILSVVKLRRSVFKHPIGLFTIMGGLGVLLSTSLSRPIYELIPGFAYIQYPWRFLTLIVFATSIVGSSFLIWLPKHLNRWVLVIPIVVAILVLNAKLFVPQLSYDRLAAFFESEEELKWRVSRLSDEYLPPSFVKPENSSQVAHEILASQDLPGFRVETEINTEMYAKLVTYAQYPIEVALNRIYFPGWKYWVNGVQQTVKVVHGLPVFMVPSDRSVVELHFTNTLVRTIGNIISLSIIVSLIFVYGKKTIT